MSALVFQETHAAARVAEQDQRLSEDTDREGRVLVSQLLGNCDRMPVSTQELPAGCAWPYADEGFILLFGKHRCLPRATCAPLVWIDCTGGSRYCRRPVEFDANRFRL